MKVVFYLIVFALTYSFAQKKEDSLSLAQSFYKSFEKELINEFSSVIDKGRMSFTLYSVKGKKYLHEIDSDSPYRPASTLKALTTATAFEYLTPQYRFQTPVTLYGEKYGNTFWGKLEVEGTGDPSISTRFHSEGEFSELELLARNIKALGIDTLWGQIELVNPNFEETNYPSVWRGKFANRCFGAKISPWIFQENCLDIMAEIIPNQDSLYIHSYPFVQEVKINSALHPNLKNGQANRRRSDFTYSIDDVKDSVVLNGTIREESFPLSFELPVRNPGAIFKSALHRALAKEEIVWINEKSEKSDAEYRTIKWTGRTLEEVVNVVNTRSHNLFAELVLRQISYAKDGRGELDKSIVWVKRFLTHNKIDTTGWVIQDGSGLSYGNRVIPRGMNIVLQNLLKSDYGVKYLNTLNYATELGASGSRMTQMLYPYGTRFKTGFVAETHGLVGYFFTASGDTLVSTLYINDYKVNDYSVKLLMDRLWTKIANFYDVERKSLLESEDLYANVKDSLVFFKRADLISGYFKGRPYLSPPTGEGYLGEFKNEPLMQTSFFDCVTYLEHVMAILYAQDKDSIFKTLQSIRYKDGDVNFHKRNHFFVEDWIKNNSKWLIPFDSLADVSSTRVSGRKKFYGFNHIEFKGEDPQTELKYFSKEKLKTLFSEKWTGEDKVMIAGLVAKLDWIWITHTGFVILKKGEVPLFRHASTKEKKVVDMPFYKYVEGRESLIGAALYELKEMK